MNINLKRIEAGQSYLERELITNKIANIVRRQPLPGRIDGGRYKFLWGAMQTHPQRKRLLNTLETDSTNQPGKSEHQWEEFVRTCAASDPAFLHGVALMHWEWALEFDENSEEGDKANLKLATYHYKRAKYYWVHLLGRPGYWQSFSKEYYKDGKDALESVSADLYQQICQALLQHHYNRCRTNFNSSNLDVAIFHLRCLCHWNVLKDKTCSGLFDQPLLKQKWDQVALETVDQEAEQIVNRWMSEWLAHANEVLDDPSAELPRGISRNFRGALEDIRPYLELAPCHPQLFQRLLSFVLTQANKWCYEMAITEDHEAALAIMEGIKPTIEQLESFLTRPAANAIATPDHKVLSTSYALWAQLVIDSDVERGQAYADAAVAWDPGDRQAGELRDQMSRVGVRVRLDQAQEYLENKEFQKALEVLDEIDLEKHPDAKETVHSLITGTHFQWSRHYADLANQETEDLLEKRIIRNIEKSTQMVNAVRYLGEARDHMAKVLKYEPGHPMLTENLEELTKEAKYRPYGIKTQIGIEHFKKDDYDNALVALEGNIPKEFPSYDTVIQVRAGCFFRRAIQHAKNEIFDAAVADMRQAQALVPDNETVREQLAELEELKRDFPYLKAMREAEVLLEKERYQDALNAMQNISSNFTGYQRVQSLRAVCEFHLGVQQANAGNYTKGIEHLERATKLNPNESVIKEQLEILRRTQKDAPSIEAVNKGQSLMKNKRFADALETMRNIPSSFGEYNEVQRLRAICEFNIGIQYANDKNLPQAIQHLTQATKYDSNEPAIKKQLEELLTVQKLGGFEAIERRNRAFQKAQEVMDVLNKASPRNPLTSQQGYQLLGKLEEAVRESDGDPQIVSLRDQMKQALSGHSRY